MYRTTRTLLTVTVLTFVSSLVGFVLALTYQWPSQFILGGPPDASVTIGDLVGGTATSAPAVTLVLLAVAAALAPSRRRRGTAAVVVLCLLGVVFVVGGLGEVLAPPTPHVSRTVLVTAGAASGALGLAMLSSGVIDLAHRARRRRATGGTHAVVHDGSAVARRAT